MVGTRRCTAAAQSGLLLAVVEDDLAAVQRELEQPNPQWVAAEGGVTALHLAAGFASPAVLEALLAAPALPPSLLDAQLQGDYTDPSVLHPLLDSAVDDTRMAFSGGATALHIAVFFGDADAVRLLLAVGAGPNIADCDGRTACHLATCTWMRRAGTGRHCNATQHPDVPALLLGAGGDIFSPTANSHGARVAPPLAILGAASSASETASHAFLTHAADQHAAGQWAPGPGINMRRLVQHAISIRNKPFFFSFWQHAGFLSELDTVQSLVRMGHLSPVNSLLSAGPAAQQNPMWSSMLATAITWQETDMVHLLLGHGVPVPCSALRAAVIGRRLQPAMLQLLLAAGPPPEPEPMPHVSFPYWTCPILTRLQRSTCRTWRLQTQPDEDAAWCSAAADCMELMANAGMKPHVYKNIAFYPFGMMMEECDPLVVMPHTFQIHGANSWLWHAYMRPAWTPTTHQQFQPTFRAAVRALLLAVHRASRQPARSAAAGLGTLPQDVLLHIIGTAAYPASAWV